MDDSAAAALSVIVTRSRLHGLHRAYVRFGDFEIGYRDLETGQVYSTEGYESMVADLTASMTGQRGTARPTPPTPPAPRAPVQPTAS